MSKHAKPWTEEREYLDGICRNCKSGEPGHKFPQHRAEGPAK